MSQALLLRLRELYEYDPDSGQFKRRTTRGNRRAGHVPTTLRPDGYMEFAIDKRLYMAHRLAWLYVHGEMPTGPIDHINRVKADNRICNLRPVEHFENLQNTAVRIDAASGRKGVQYRHGKWRARITLRQQRIHLGVFNSADEASAAYAEAAARLHKYNPSAEQGTR